MPPDEPPIEMNWRGIAYWCCSFFIEVSNENTPSWGGCPGRENIL